VDFDLSEEQRDLRDAVRKFLRASFPAAALRDVVDGRDTGERSLWNALARELELPGLSVPEEFGGAGAGLLELCLVLEELGRVCYPGPFLASAGLAARTLLLSAAPAAQDRWLPAIAAGELVATVAPSVLQAEAVRPRAARGPGGWTLDGTEAYVLNGAGADLIVVAADSDAGCGLFAVQAGRPGLTVRALRGLDPTRPLARVELRAAPAIPVGSPAAGAAVADQLRGVASILLAAEQLGGMQACVEMAVGYASARHQFGRPIGSFQAIKHKCANMFVEADTSRAMVAVAAWAVDSGACHDLPALGDLTGAHVSDAFLRVAAENLQVHGGIGYTWEHDAHLYFKRATASQRLLSMPQRRRAAIAARAGLGG
jgi:alkylation response protein AidB-like acyl-CoA dehydrogenase